MRTICTFAAVLFAATFILPVPATAGAANGLNDIYAQATPADQSTAKKQKAKRKRTPKVEYMRAVPSR